MTEVLQVKSLIGQDQGGLETVKVAGLEIWIKSYVNSFTGREELRQSFRLSKPQFPLCGGHVM